MYISQTNWDWQQQIFNMNYMYLHLSNDYLNKTTNKLSSNLKPVPIWPASNTFREEVKTTILEKDPPNHKMVGGICLHPPCLTSKDGVFIA